VSEKVVTKCQICGKVLTRDHSVEVEKGHRCETLIAEGWTGEKLQAHYATVTVNQVPEGYVKLATFHGIIAKHKSTIPGLTVTKLVNAIGKDRGIESAIHPVARPVYDSRKTRWVNPWLATKAGLTAIATGDFSKAPKSK